MPRMALHISVAAFGEILSSRPAHFTVLSGSRALIEYLHVGNAIHRLSKVKDVQLKSLP